MTSNFARKRLVWLTQSATEDISNNFYDVEYFDSEESCSIANANVNLKILNMQMEIVSMTVNEILIFMEAVT